MRNDAPRAAVHASPRQKAIGFVHSVQRIIRTAMFDLVGQRRRVVFIACAGTYDLARVIIRTVGREGEDLRHVYPIVMPEHRVGELHPIALRLMPRRQLHQREIRKMMPVDIYEAYFLHRSYSFIVSNIPNS